MDPDISNNHIPSGHRETRDLDPNDLNTIPDKRLISAYSSNETKDSEETLSYFFIFIHRFKPVEIKYHQV